MKFVLEKIIYFWFYLMILPFKILDYLFPKRFFEVYSFDILKKLFIEKKEVNSIFFDTFDKQVFGRGRSFVVHEPDTLNWINTYIKKDDILFDIGANIGVYSLNTAKNIGSRIYSFEPESSNYYYLNKNIL